MEVVEMLPMNGGDGERSYAQNSLFQQKIISMTWSVTKEAITNLYCTTFPTSLAIADLGCPSGPNTLMVVSNLIREVEKIRQKLDRRTLEYQILFNDLHGNDFNSIFSSLPSFHEKLKTQLGNGLGPCFFTGVPGSFYGRLFPGKSLHFVHSFYSIHWLSQVPEGLEANKGNIFISDTSPEIVLDNYQKQYQKDFSMFLKCRAEELVKGGCMVLTSLMRTSENRYDKESYYTWSLLNLAVADMVTKGVVEEEKVNSFNIPIYMPSLSEVKTEVLNEGNFTIDRLHVSRIDCNSYNTEVDNPPNIVANCDYNYVKCMRAVAEPLLIRHFGEAIIDELFHRFEKIVKDHMADKKRENINLTISLTKIK